jgi:hypothetical protein
VIRRAAAGRAAVLCALAAFLLVCRPLNAAAVDARLTRVIKNVTIAGPNVGSRTAALGGVAMAGNIVRTAADSRAELSFADRSVARLGAKTALRLTDRDWTLEEGAVLVQAPRGASAVIRTGTINIDAAGSTGIAERFGATYVKIMLLEGTARVFLPQKVGESMLLKPGQMLIMKPEAKGLPEPVDFEIGQLYRTSLLIGRDFGRLASQPQIAAEIQKQRSNPNLIPTNLIIYGRGTLVNLADPDQAKRGASKPTASPTPARSPARP